MAGRNMNLDVIVRLRDLLSGPLRRLRSSFEGLVGFTKKIGALAAIVTGITFMGPIQEAASFQQKLLDIAGTQELVGKAAYGAVDDMKTQFEGLALKVGQTSDMIAQGAGQMIAAGLDRSLVDASLFGIARATKAANAEFSDMAGVATSLLQTLRLPASELDGALAGLVVAGKAGAFELKDMARYFPTLTSQMNKLGLTGRLAGDQLAAMLQIARKGTADPAEAANNLKNFLDKITAPETMKRFRDLGVDISAVMKDAAVKGINPIEAVIQKVTKLTGVSNDEIAKFMAQAKANGLQGADALAEVQKQITAIHGAGKLGEIFADQQVMGFLMPMLANIEEYKRIKALISGANVGVIDDDFDTQMDSINTQLTTFMEIFDQIKRELGMASAPLLKTINEYLLAGLELFRQWDTATDGMSGQLILAGGGVIAFAAGLGVLGMAVPLVVGGIKALLSPLRMMSGLFRGMAGAGVGIGSVADSLERVNSAAIKARGIQRPSMWSMLFGVGNSIALLNQIPSDRDELKTFMDGNKKQWDGYSNWMEANIGSPRTWLGLDKNVAPKPPVDIEGLESLKKTIADITKTWPLAAQLGMRDYQNELINGGANAEKNALSIGEDIKAQLSIVASPTIDTSSLEKAINLSKELADRIKGVGSVGVHGLAANQNSSGVASALSNGLAPAALPQSAAPTTVSKTELNGNLTIGLAPGLVLRGAQTDAPGVNLATGRAVGRE